MESNLKSLARGALQSSSSVLYAPPSGIRGILTSIHLHNQDVSSQNISVWVVIKNTKVPLCPLEFSFGSNYTIELIDEKLGLEPGDFVLAKARVNNRVTFNITGYEDIL